MVAERRKCVEPAVRLFRLRSITCLELTGLKIIVCLIFKYSNTVVGWMTDTPRQQNLQQTSGCNIQAKRFQSFWVMSFFFIVFGEKMRALNKQNYLACSLISYINTLHDHDYEVLSMRPHDIHQNWIMQIILWK